MLEVFEFLANALEVWLILKSRIDSHYGALISAGIKAYVISFGSAAHIKLSWWQIRGQLRYI